MSIKSIKTGFTGISALAGNDQWFGDFSLIQHTQLLSVAGDVTFSSIPSDYTHLQLRMFALGDTTTGYDTYIQFNGDSATNYSSHRMGGNGASTFATGYANTNGLYLVTDAARTLYPAVSVTDILDYKDTTKFKTVRTIGGTDANGSGQCTLWSGNWRNKNAITSIKILVAANNFAANSSFALYGIRG